MQVSVEIGAGLERRLTVALEPEQVDAEVEKRLREFARSARMPGFRPGKIPVKTLRQRYGTQIRGEVFSELMQSTFGQALTEQQLNPVAQPAFSVDMDPEAGRYAYTATFDVLPEFELGSLAGKTLKRPLAAVADADLEALVERLREQRKTFNEVTRPAQDGDRVTLSFVATLVGESEPFPGGSGQDFQLVLGSGQMIPGFEAGLVGATAGEERVLELSFPATYHAEHLKGKAASFVVTVQTVAEPQLPEVDAEFAKAFGVEDGDIERFRQDVRANMTRELKQRVEARIKSQALDLLLATNPIEIPQSLVAQEIQALKEQMRQNLRGNTKIELPDNLFEESAQRRVRLGLVLARVVKANEIKADPERVREAVEDLASTYENPKEVVDFYYGSKEHLASVEALALEGQVVDWVLTQVQVEDEPLGFQELMNPATA
ncbi:MAG: trigger factor [Chromatiaceae bacterium]|nr:trigger factor [Chromatiaceae bacterium]